MMYVSTNYIYMECSLTKIDVFSKIKYLSQIEGSLMYFSARTAQIPAGWRIQIMFHLDSRVCRQSAKDVINFPALKGFSVVESVSL